MVCKIIFCSEFPDIPEKLSRRRRKWQFQSAMFYKSNKLIVLSDRISILLITKTTTSQGVCFVIIAKHVSSNSTKICNKCLNAEVFQIKKAKLSNKKSIRR